MLATIQQIFVVFGITLQSGGKDKICIYTTSTLVSILGSSLMIAIIRGMNLVGAKQRVGKNR